MSNSYANADPFAEFPGVSPTDPADPAAPAPAPALGSPVPPAFGGPAPSAPAFGGPAPAQGAPAPGAFGAESPLGPFAPTPSPSQFYGENAFPLPHAGPPAPPNAVPIQQGPSAEQAKESTPTSKFWTIQFYQQFFDVDTRLVLQRVSNTLFPINPPDFLMDRDWQNNGEPNDPPYEVQEAGGTLSRKPDLYGPFWICTTLWMTLGIVSNIISKLSYNHKIANVPDPERWKYDFTMVSAACILSYLYCFALPSIIWGVMKYKGLPISILDTICLYGYSLFIFILVALLCMIPVSALQWAVVVVGGAWSTAFLLINFWNVWKAALSMPWIVGFASVVGSLHMLLAMSFKFYFVNYKY